MRVMSSWAIALSILAGIPCPRVCAQGAACPSFDVASIRETPPGQVGGRLGVMSVPGRVIIENIPLSNLIEYAYDKTPAEIVGSPEWSRTRFDITAT